MQDRYTADIGDFGKYGLLRALTRPPLPDGHPRLRLGILWYLTRPEPRRPDGRKTAYRQLRPCDGDLYDAIRAIVTRGPRTVSRIRARRIFPADTVYWEDLIPTITPTMARGDRMALRLEWAGAGARRDLPVRCGLRGPG